MKYSTDPKPLRFDWFSGMCFDVFGLALYIIRAKVDKSERVLSVNSRRHFCHGGGEELLVFDSSEFVVEGSIDVKHSLCILFIRL
ncbi:hypothetical protein QVD17_02032 [Tagetes erecta]|uniref:Uncharacterized protein n=1 Tax=Tagetes erecta TaxID=13708 RepID=A0AAD8LAW0_TARER|nr:hypothetical protein QVD17_02032 [Tagetes erecta]